MSYQPSSREPHWQQYREQQQTYAFDLHDTSRPVYSIDTPPPTVSGKLHIGHVFSYIQAELIARYKRMTGHNVYYPMGYDDNGIPTEILVEKELGIDIKTTPRAEFIAKCLEVTAKYREIYQNLWKSFGVSVDRSNTYSTISPQVQKIAQQRFVDLYHKGAIVKKSFPALRCRATQSTTAQSELEEKEVESMFHYVRFDVVSDEAGTTVVGTLPIATTRPELMPACVAVVVHPDDERYASYQGLYSQTPRGHIVPIITDTEMKMDKGTGAMMCCSYGDEHDTQIIISRNLTPRVIVGKSGKIEGSGIPEIEGLKTHQARTAIIPLLEAKGVLIKSVAITQSVKYTERGKVPVEIIPVDQWFVNTLSIRDQLHDLNQQMTRRPDHMSRKLTSRIDGLQRDWNISRNRSFGIPIPVWYSKKTGEIILPDSSQLPIDPLTTLPFHLPADHNADDIVGETLVLDTRFTSGLTRDINQSLIQSKGSQLSLMPFSLRPQAHEIIRTRLFYTTIQSRYAHGHKAFDHVMISGWALAAKGEKFSKSAGNSVYDPATLVEKYSADAVRYRCLSSQLGRDTFFEENEIKVGHKLVNKLRNASQFVQGQLGDAFTPDHTYTPTVDTDRRILERLDETIIAMRQQLEHYEGGPAKQAFEDFFWNDFCDTYLELIKTRIYQPELFTDGVTKQHSARQTLYRVFLTIIKLIAPYLPHITEEIYQGLFQPREGGSSIHLQSYPLAVSIGKQSENNYHHIYQTIVAPIISAVRKYKADHQLSLSTPLSALAVTVPQTLLEGFRGWQDDVIGITKAEQLHISSGEVCSIEIR